MPAMNSGRMREFAHTATGTSRHSRGRCGTELRGPQPPRTGKPEPGAAAKRLSASSSHPGSSNRPTCGCPVVAHGRLASKICFIGTSGLSPCGPARPDLLNMSEIYPYDPPLTRTEVNILLVQAEWPINEIRSKSPLADPAGFVSRSPSDASVDQPDRNEPQAMPRYRPAVGSSGRDDTHPGEPAGQHREGHAKRPDSSVNIGLA